MDLINPSQWPLLFLFHKRCLAPYKVFKQNKFDKKNYVKIVKIPNLYVDNLMVVGFLLTVTSFRVTGFMVTGLTSHTVLTVVLQTVQRA